MFSGIRDSMDQKEYPSQTKPIYTANDSMVETEIDTDEDSYPRRYF